MSAFRRGQRVYVMSGPHTGFGRVMASRVRGDRELVDVRLEDGTILTDVSSADLTS